MIQRNEEVTRLVLDTKPMRDEEVRPSNSHLRYNADFYELGSLLKKYASRAFRRRSGSFA
jgi:hypothetical protein